MMNKHAVRISITNVNDLSKRLLEYEKGREIQTASFKYYQGSESLCTMLHWREDCGCVYHNRRWV